MSKKQSQAAEGSGVSKANSSSIKAMVSSGYGFDWPIASDQPLGEVST